MPLADPACPAHWRDDPVHRAYLLADARAQLAFFQRTLRADGGFDHPDHDGTPLPRTGQELHHTTRMVHSYALGQSIGHPGSDDMIDAGLAYLTRHHRDPVHGGYFWSVNGTSAVRDEKLAYGHVFVLLAASSALLAGHPKARALFDDVAEVLETRFWDDGTGRFEDEFTADWQRFSTYRGMNANMHGVEALLAAFEATGETHWLTRAERILDFFTRDMARDNGWRIPEHYTAQWQVDPAYRGDPTFRPPGTTPGHSLEFARLLLQHWDLAGRPPNDAPDRARHLAEQALADGWRPDGGLVYTLGPQGRPDRPDRFWWPVTEGIGALAALLKSTPTPSDETWYRRLWVFADTHFIDHTHGGWFPEIGEDGRPAPRQFPGKPDIYHALQAGLYALTPGLSRHQTALPDCAPAPASSV